jgi:hypothetical protein
MSEYLARCPLPHKERDTTMANTLTHLHIAECSECGKRFYAQSHRVNRRRLIAHLNVCIAESITAMFHADEDDER